MQQTVDQFLRDKGVTTVAQAKKLLIGRKVQVVAIWNNAWPVGSKHTITDVNNWSYGNPIYASLLKGNAAQWYLHSVVFVNDSIQDLQETQKSNKETIKGLQGENQTIDAQIAFMQENKLEVFDEELFKVYHVLKTLDNEKLSGLARAQAIAKIIKG